MCGKLARPPTGSAAMATIWRPPSAQPTSPCGPWPSRSSWAMPARPSRSPGPSIRAHLGRTCLNGERCSTSTSPAPTGNAATTPPRSPPCSKQSGSPPRRSTTTWSCASCSGSSSSVSAGPPPLACAHSPNESECCSTDVACLERAASGPRDGSLVLPPRPGWRDLAGRCGHAQPPAASAPPTKPALEPSPLGNLIQNGPTSLALLLAPGGLSACHGVHRPRFQGQGRPPGQATGKGQHHDRAERELRRNLTDDPELRHTEGGIARAMFRVAV